MSTTEITSPRAAELYFNSSLVGHFSAFLAESLAGSLHRGSWPARKPAARAEAHGSRTLLDRLDAWLWRQEQKRREAYLADARDLFELERRMEAIDRGAFVRYY
jgi:uncharacterized protein DUF3563